MKEDGGFKEWGVFVSNGEAKKKPKSKECFDMLKGGASIRETVERYPAFVNNIPKCAGYIAEPRGDSGCPLLYVYGPTGTGKTTNILKTVQEMTGDMNIRNHMYVKASGSKWWDVYMPYKHKIILLEEFQSCFSCTIFLQFTNSFPPELEIKGGWVPNAAKAVIITSNTAPDDQYPNVKLQHPSTWAAYRRRITDEYDTGAQQVAGRDLWECTRAYSSEAS